MEKDITVRKIALLVRKEEEEEKLILLPSSDTALISTRNVKLYENL